MATHMAQFRYSLGAIQGLVDTPQNRREAAAKMFAAAGGNMEELYFCFGDYDGVAMVDFPSNVDAASAVLAVAASGAFSSVKTTVLLSMEDGHEAMKKAHEVAKAYAPPAS